jgi:uncharacterized Zn finger protein (UPF0148 family)
MDERRILKKCPKCGYNLLARDGCVIICLDSNCDWAVQSKRQEDSNIPLYTDLKREFNG